MRNALLVLAFAAPAAPALAQSEPPPTWTIGAIALDRDSPYRDIDEGAFVVPLVRYEGERFFFRGTRGSFRLAKSETYEFTVFGQARLDGYDPKDSAFLAGMDKRRISLDLGLASTWTSRKIGQFELSVAADALDRSGGVEATASWNGLLRAGRWTFIPGASVSWKNADLADYYYGVRTGEALPGRPAYSPGAAVVPEVSMLATHPLGERWTLFARASHTWLPSEITDSPIVESDGSTGLFLGIGYSPK
jgi:MipA family protein